MNELRINRNLLVHIQTIDALLVVPESRTDLVWYCSLLARDWLGGGVCLALIVRAVAHEAGRFQIPIQRKPNAVAWNRKLWISLLVTHWEHALLLRWNVGWLNTLRWLFWSQEDLFGYKKQWVRSRHHQICTVSVFSPYLGSVGHWLDSLLIQWKNLLRFTVIRILLIARYVKRWIQIALWLSPQIATVNSYWGWNQLARVDLIWCHRVERVDVLLRSRDLRVPVEGALEAVLLAKSIRIGG